MIPRAALILGLAGLLPFIAGAWLSLAPASGGPHRYSFLTDGPRLLVEYGAVILCFMSGVLWGFATRAAGREAAIGYAVSVVPALYVFFLVGLVSPPDDRALIVLLAGFLGLLVADGWFARAGLAPSWWMRLRLLLTAGVAVCLLIGLYA